MNLAWAVLFPIMLSVQANVYHSLLWAKSLSPGPQLWLGWNFLLLWTEACAAATVCIWLERVEGAGIVTL